MFEPEIPNKSFDDFKDTALGLRSSIRLIESLVTSNRGWSTFL